MWMNLGRSDCSEARGQRAETRGQRPSLRSGDGVGMSVLRFPFYQNRLNLDVAHAANERGCQFAAGMEAGREFRLSATSDRFVATTR